MLRSLHITLNLEEAIFCSVLWVEHFLKILSVGCYGLNMPKRGIPVFTFHQKTSLVAHTVKHLPTLRETRVRSPGGKDPLEKEMATHSSTFAWKTPWTEEHGRLQSMGSQRVRHN